MDIPDEVERMFAERVANPFAWFAHSRSLLAAARATAERAAILIDVWQRSDLMNVASMLYGFALENLFKARYVLQKFGSPHEEGWCPEPVFPAELKSHDLLKLAQLAGVELDSGAELSLKILSDVTTWSGRYPCSLKGDEGTIGRYPATNDDAERLFKKYSRPFTSIS